MGNTITKEQLQAMKKADGFVYRNDGIETQVECLKRVKNPLGGYETELFRVNIPVECFSDIPFCFSNSFQTGAEEILIRVLKAGDKITLRAAENGNGYLQAAVIPQDRMDNPEYHPGGYDKVFHDCLFLTVQRNGKTIVRDLLVADSVTPQNSARAIGYK